MTKKGRGKKYSSWVIFGLAGFLLLGAVMINIQHKQQIANHFKTTNIGSPSAKRPSPATVTSYTVPPDNPRYITIPSIGIGQTRVISLGTKNNQISTPDNIYDTGWYNTSAKPGQDGAMFIFGHVSSWEANGIFYDLKKLKAGDQVIIQRGDGKSYTYIVNKSKVYPVDQVDMNKVLKPIDSNKPGLNLMTCTGQVIKGTNNFSERLVVFTSLSG
jgi:LPXTG-site transpeptidase (sortase) family protein